MKTRPQCDFWQGIHTHARRTSSLLRASFELTYGCNFACRHCYVPPGFCKKYRPKELSTAGVFSVLAQLKRLGCLYLGFTGGEPFMRPDILKIITYACEQGFEVLIYTNASLIDEKCARALATLRLNKVDITLPAMSDTVFDLVTGTRGMRAKVFEAAAQLFRLGVPLGFKTCLVKENKPEIKAIERFAQSLKADYRLTTSISARLDGNTKPLHYAYTPQVKRKSRASHSCLLCAERGMADCLAGKTQAAITPAGELKLCVIMHEPLYPLPENDGHTQWERLRQYKLWLQK